MKAVRIVIFGAVQGVFFRVSAKEKADELGIRGFARNMPDDSLYIEAEGEEEALQEFIAWCRKGPPQARVDRAEINETGPKGFTDFNVNRSI